MSKSQRSLVPGFVLIALGFIFLLPKFTPIRMRELWPLFVIGTGVMFFVGYLADRKKYGLLMPAIVVTVVGLLLFYCQIEGWHHMASFWPVFIIAPGIGFLAMYYFGPRELGFMVVGLIITAFGAIFFLNLTSVDYLWPAILIAVGIVLIVNSRRK